MRKKLLLICAVFWTFCAEFALGQITGTGTVSDPYAGTVIESDVWTGDEIYATDLVISSDVVLTISPGELDASHLIIMEGGSFTIAAGGTFIINPNAMATIPVVLNNGLLRLESGPGEPGVASLIHDSYSGSGITEVELYLSGGTFNDEYIWHYISMPFSGIAATYFNTPNVAHFLENLTTASGNDPGWTTYTGYQYSTGNVNSGYAFSTLELGKGYNYYAAAAATFILQSALNIESVQQNLSYSGVSDYQGYNLIGNPFASCIDWEYMVSGDHTGGINNAIYLTNRDKMAAYVAGISVNGATQFIPPLQGFFVKSTAVGGFVEFDPAARVHSPDQTRYKKKSAGALSQSNDTISILRLRLTTPGDSSDLIVRFNERATNAFDKELEAYTFSKTMGNVNIWTTTGNIDYCINALPYPVESIDVPVGVYIKIPGTYRLSPAKLKNLDLYNFTLKDLHTNRVADLKEGEYLEFTSEAGLTEDRFVITVTKSATDITDVNDTGEIFSIYTGGDGIINIRSLQNDDAFYGSIRVYDLTGRKIYYEPNVEWSARYEIKQIKLENALSGLYLVEIVSGTNRFVVKVALN